MLLICTAYGGTDEGPAAAALAVPLTPEFIQSLHRRQRLAQDLCRAAASVGFDSLLFSEASLSWLSWSEEMEDTLQAAEAAGLVLADESRIPLAESEHADGPSPLVRTDCEFMQVWPERFQFRCRLRNEDTALESAMLYFDDFFTAAAHRSAAAQGRLAA